MRYHLVAGVATSAFTLLTSATSNVPSDCTHQDHWGNAVVENKASEPIYFVLDNQPATATIAPSSETSIPIYEKNADKGGMSIKLFKDKDTDIWGIPTLTQFEITATDLQYFDISNVNSNIGNGKNGNGEDCDKEPPFVKEGMKIKTADKEIICEPGENPCKTAYSKNDDNFATAATDLGNEIKLTIGLSGGSAFKGASDKIKNVVNKVAGNKADQSKSEDHESKKDQKDHKDQKQSQQQQEQPEQEQPKQHPQLQKLKLENKQQVAEPSKTEPDASEQTVWSTVYADPAVKTIVVDQDGNPVTGHHKRQEHIHQHVHNKFNKRRHAA